MLSDVQLEKRILSSVIHSYDEDHSRGLGLHLISEASEQWFTTPENKALFRTIEKVVRNGQSPTAVHCDHEIESAYTPYVWELGSTATTNDIGHFLEELRTIYVSYNLHSVALKATHLLYTAEDQREALATVEKEIFAAVLSGQKKSRHESTFKAYMGQYWEEKNKQMAEDYKIGITTGIPKLDALIGGFRDGETVVVAGRTGMGKSSLVMTMIAKQIMQGYKPALFSFELNRVELVDKLVSMLSEFDNGETVPFRNIFNPQRSELSAGLSQGQMVRMSEITGKYLSNLDGWIRGTSTTTVEEVMSTCRKLLSEGKMDILYIDHIGHLVRDKNKATAELSHITGSLKLFAGEMNIPVVEVVQLNRDADTVKEKPRLSHMKGSGSIEEDANIIIMPWRPFAIDRTSPPSESEIILAKSRNSMTGDIPSYFSEVTTSFTECYDSKSESGPTEPQERF
jgi:replicative DNA helicase